MSPCAIYLLEIHIYEKNISIWKENFSYCVNLHNYFDLAVLAGVFLWKNIEAYALVITTSNKLCCAFCPPDILFLTVKWYVIADKEDISSWVLCCHKVLNMWTPFLLIENVKIIGLTLLIHL